MTHTDKVIFESLKKWRLDKAKNKGWPAYTIFHNSHLQNIVNAKPKTLDELLTVNGVGPKKIKEYGNEIISMFNCQDDIITTNKKNRDINYNFFKNVYEASIERCNPTYQFNRNQWITTDRGTAILNTESECDIYTKYYGARHNIVLSQQSQILLDSYENYFCDNLIINDFGAGQGFGTFTFIEEMIKKDIKCNRLTINLIEPSDAALEKAKNYIEELIQYGSPKPCNKYKINKINLMLDEMDQDLSSINSKRMNYGEDTTINIFSNILDVDSVDIDELIESLNCINNDYNFFICNSPVINNYSRMNKLNDFYTYFQNNYNFTCIQNNKNHHVTGKAYYFSGSYDPDLRDIQYRYKGFIFKTENEG
tara:strand:+ start:1758 stop:2855 length:1098 start_codon:yes stop_codon:yes gene_type:complete